MLGQAGRQLPSACPGMGDSVSPNAGDAHRQESNEEIHPLDVSQSYWRIHEIEQKLAENEVGV